MNLSLKRAKTTERAMEVYTFLKDYISQFGFPPSIREIQANTCIKSTASIHTYLSKLEENGLIRISRNKKRAIEIVPEKEEDMPILSRKIPHLGTIAAGNPILAIERVEDYYDLPVSLVPRTGVLFMLSVYGSSMIEIGIFEDDMLIVRQQNTANNGDIVIAMVDGRATVKRFYKEKNCIRLHPENKNLTDIILPTCDILGIVINVIRTIR